MDTPVLLITFNRPVQTRRVLESIMAAQPRDLYVFRDGPREGNSRDVQKCAEVIRVVDEVTMLSSVRVHSFYSEKNLGCGPGPSAAISWFFDNEEQGMIFEDDCLPSPSLFPFYECLLNRYKNDDRISLITGTNVLSKWRSKRYDYIFSKTGGMTMGCWASWRRAWSMFDFEIKTWGDEQNRTRLRNIIGQKLFLEWKPLLDSYYSHPPKDVWDYQWAYARKLNNTFTIVSSINQVSNIGFGCDSTHTPNQNDRRGNMKLFNCRFPLKTHRFHVDKVFDWEMYQRFSRTSRKSIALRCLLKLVDLMYRH